jgi:hypothetical protein
MRRYLERVFRAPLPVSATNLCDWRVHLLVPVRKGSFECSPDELEDFLQRSPVLPNALETGTGLPFMNSALEWWRPEQLRERRGVRCEWLTEERRSVCLLVAGREPGSDLAKVYYQVEDWPASVAPVSRPD